MDYSKRKTYSGGIHTLQSLNKQYLAQKQTLGSLLVTKWKFICLEKLKDGPLTALNRKKEIAKSNLSKT